MADTSTNTGALFDVDGTLVDSPYLHVITWWQAFRQYGHDVGMARIHRAIGMGSDKILDHLLGDERDRDDDDALRAAHDSLYGAYWPSLRPTPGAADLLRACAGRGMRVVLASSAGAREFKILRAVIDAEDVIHAATSSADAEESKPAPDILQAALDQADLPADTSVFVGDAVWDVYAAAKLDIPCIGLTCGGLSADELREAGAVEVYENPAALLDNLDRSVLTSRNR
jgi:HAD superfamily hydrolase (TIGR01509 family)